jgi:tRNA U34 2-thiouridine synthase MnmA/TrmU
MQSSVVLAGPSMTWVDRPLAPGARAVAQVSAHGRPVPCTVAVAVAVAVADAVTAAADYTAALEVIFDDPQRPVAPGQTVALYDALDPDAVVGAGIAA